MSKRTALAALVTASAMMLAGPVLAAPGGNGQGKGNTPNDSSSTGGTTTIILNQAAPHHGDRITFTVSSTKTDRPFTNVQCFQNGVEVYGSFAGHFDDYHAAYGEPDHVLSSLNWTSGAADCVVNLIYQSSNGRWRTEASVPFWVAA